LKRLYYKGSLIKCQTNYWLF